MQNFIHTHIHKETTYKLEKTPKWILHKCKTNYINTFLQKKKTLKIKRCTNKNCENTSFSADNQSIKEVVQQSCAHKLSVREILREYNFPRIITVMSYF